MFLFVDQILKLEPGKFAQGVRHVTQGDPFMRASADGSTTAMVSCVIGEALGQLGAWSVMAANDFTLRPVAGIVGGVGIHDEVRAGETLTLDTTIDSVSDQAVQYHAVATAGGRKVLTLEDAVGPFLPMNDFSDPAVVREQFGTIHRPGGIDGDRWVNPPPPRLRGASHLDEFVFDKIEVVEPGVVSVATKHVTADQRFFVDHFPHKPVVPLSLLLETLLQQAGTLVGAGARPTRVRSIKMRRFLEPGDALTATVRVRERSEGRARIQFRCDINDKRACTATAEFATSPVGETA